MMDDKEYVERLEKIIDKQDDLLKHLDSKFRQQESLNNELSKQNSILREDIKKHKNLLMDMNKTVNQHKNVVNKLKKELEDQLKIQQDLHKDYGKVIKELTDELEEEKNKVNAKPVNKNSSNDGNKVELPPKEHEKDYVSEASDFVSDLKDKSSNTLKDLTAYEEPDGKFCKNCGAKIEPGFLFCDSCGHKVT